MDTSRPPRWTIPIFSLVGLAILVLLGYLIITRISAIQESVTSLNDELKQVNTQLEEVSDQADMAHARASQAEAVAQEAAEGRILAEAETIQAREMARLAQEEVDQVRKAREQELERLQNALSKVAETRRTALGLVMNLGDDSLKFDFDKSNLRPENRELLSRIVGILLTSQDFSIYVYGHTDDVGTEQYNQDLSERRAQSVHDYLIQGGIDPRIITMKGFGKSKPLVPGKTAEARAKNRRVEIGIVDAVITYGSKSSNP